MARRTRTAKKKHQTDLPQTAFACPLSVYFERHDDTNAARLAVASGVPHASISFFCRRVRGLRWASMQKLEKATGGEVKARALLDWQLGLNPSTGRAA